MINKAAIKNMRRYNADQRCRYIETKMGTQEFTKVMITLETQLGTHPPRKSVKFAVGALVHLRGIGGKHARSMVITCIRSNRWDAKS